MEYKKCECGRCDEIIPEKDNRYRPLKYKKGHRKLKESRIIDCACGCGELISNLGANRQIRKFKHGHHAKGSGNGRWIGGKIIDKDGYILIKKRDHPFANKGGYVREHRLVYEYYLKILFDEDIYIPRNIEIDHENKIKNDNSLINLRPIYYKEHRHLYHKRIEQRNCLLCNSNETYKDKRSNEMWYRYNEGFICLNCYSKNKKKIRGNDLINVHNHNYQTYFCRTETS